MRVNLFFVATFRSAFLAFAIWFPAMAQAAGIIAGARTATSVTSGPDGREVVSIAPPVAGVSHNVYQQFNVGRAGADLDNTGKGARLIVSEVAGNAPSLIEGRIAVLGPRASLVIANANGITVNGARFVNTGNVALTTSAISLLDFRTGPDDIQRNVVLDNLTPKERATLAQARSNCAAAGGNPDSAACMQRDSLVWLDAKRDAGLAQGAYSPSQAREWQGQEYQAAAACPPPYQCAANVNAEGLERYWQAKAANDQALLPGYDPVDVWLGLSGVYGAGRAVVGRAGTGAVRGSVLEGEVGSAAKNIYVDTRPMESIFPELKGVNPHYVEDAAAGVNTNCVSCVNAAQQRLTGQNPNAVATPSAGYANQNALLPSAPFGFGSSTNPASVVAEMQQAGNGAVRPLIVQQSGVDHVINVANRNGQIYFIDTQLGQIVRPQPDVVVKLGRPR